MTNNKDKNIVAFNFKTEFKELAVFLAEWNLRELNLKWKINGKGITTISLLLAIKYIKNFKPLVFFYRNSDIECIYLEYKNTNFKYLIYFNSVIMQKDKKLYETFNNLKIANFPYFLHDNFFSNSEENEFFRVKITLDLYFFNYEVLLTMAGRKMQKRRNLRNYYLKNHAKQTKILDYNLSNFSEVSIFLKAFFNAPRFQIKGLPNEKTNEIPIYFEFLKYVHFFKNIEMKIFYVNDKIAAIISGEQINDTLNILMHNCNIKYKGIYQYTLTQFLNTYKDKKIRYVNLYDSVNIDSLDQAKMRYVPEFKLKIAALALKKASLI